MRSFALFIIGICVFLTSCSKENAVVAPKSPDKPVATTPERISILKQTESFVLEKDNKTQAVKLSLRKNALEKDFLLFGFIARQAGMGLLDPALTRALMTRVIRFRLKDRNLIMEECPEGHHVDKNWKPTLLLGVFPVSYENDDRIVCEFNAGFNRVYLSSAYKSPTESMSYTHNFTWDNLVNSYIDEVRLWDRNEATIRQIAQFPVSETNDKGEKVNEQLETFEILYHLHPYSPSKTFAKTNTDKLLDVGFFETHPRLIHSKGTENFAFKINTEKPFVFALSSNTPEEYVKAIEDGVFYWNRVAGKKIVDVKKAPPGMRAPSYEHNIIQWVNAEEVPLAYFQAQADPKTGEVLHFFP